MRIGCLQFAPQVGDVENNLNRADSVLSKANPEDLELLDLLVLPELAFTGYNFKSLQEITPFLEPSGSGISSLWARTIALKYNTTVIVGYPEKVDVSPRWPTSPEYYNSAIVVNGEGETIVNYRKHFLFSVDETWALEGRGFFGGFLPGLGDTAIGICMDINPRKFEAPWHAFEFAFHVMEMRANLVVVTMAWLTREDGRLYSRMPAEPDMETLTYWVQRLEPLIRDESEEEIIVVFCNRTGFEGEVVYAGTSAVIGIKGGEVNVYGLLGRGVKDLLVVNTDTEPIAKLVHRPDEESQEADTQMVDQKSPVSSEGKAAKPPTKDHKSSHSPETSGNSPKGVVGRTRRSKPQSPRIIIPERRKYPTTNSGAIDESPTIPTPTNPSPTPLSVRPKIDIPGSRPTKEHVNTPYPHDESTREHLTPDHMHFYGSNVHASKDDAASRSDNSEHAPETLFFLPSQTLIATPREPTWPMFAPESPTVTVSLVRYSGSESGVKKNPSAGKRASSSFSEFSSGSSLKSGRSGRSRHSNVGGRATAIPAVDKDDETAPPRPSSPKSRNASRSGRPLDRRNSEIERPDLTGMAQRLEALCGRAESPSNHHDTDYPAYHDRPQSPKSRNASRSGRPIDASQAVDERNFSLSRTSIPIAASPGVLAGSIDRPASDIFQKAANLMKQRAAGFGEVRPSSRAEQQSTPMVGSSAGQPRSRSASSAPEPNGELQAAHIEPDETRTLVWSEISKIVGEKLERPGSSSATRGRQLGGRSPPNDSQITYHTRSESRGAPTGSGTQEHLAFQEGRGTVDRAIASQPGSHNGPVNAGRGPPPPYHPDDEIVAEIIFHAPGCPTHSHRNTPNQSNAGTPSQASNPAVHQRNNSRPGQASNPRLAQRMNSASAQMSNAPSNRRPMIREQSLDNSEMEISVFKAPTPLTTSGRGESTDSCPTMSGSSIHTINSPNGSPATPPPRVFEPTTPKAMKLDQDFGTLLSSVSDPANSGTLDSLTGLGSGLVTGLGLDRPRSSVW